MTDQKRYPGTLWIFRNNAMRSPAREVALSSDDAIYQLFRHTSSPFIKRVISPKAVKLERSDEDLKQLFQFFENRMRYQVSPTNLEEPFERRGLTHPPPPPAQNTYFVEPPSMMANVQRLPWMIEVFFQSILTRVRHDPNDFPEVVQELMVQFKEDRIKIKLYNAYRQIGSMRELIQTLEEISQYPAPETFDLFCSALFVYYDKVISAQEEKEKKLREAEEKQKAEEEAENAKALADTPPEIR